jgi:predicted ferric reductase
VTSLAQAVLWVAVYLLLVSAPLLALVLGPAPPGTAFWWDFSMGLGFAGMAMMGMQFALTARFRRAAAPFGIDIIYYFHRYAAVIALALLAGHFLILRIRYAPSLGALDPREAPWRMTAGRIALLLFAVLVVTSLWRKQMRLEYYRWRISHAAMATLAVLASLLHIKGVGYYTAAPGTAWLWTAYASFWLALLLYVRFARPWMLTRRPWRVVGVRQERGNAWTLSLEPEAHAGLRFAPGQFAWLTVRASPFAAAEHPFSFASSAAAPPGVEFSIKELGDFSRSVKTIEPGETAYVDGPYGGFSIDQYPAAPGFMFIAGGAGIAPIMSMLRTAADRGERRPFTLVYGNGEWDRVMFREELDSLCQRLSLTVVYILERPAADWTGERGHVRRELLLRHLAEQHRAVEYFTCGPKPMTDIVQRALRSLGVPRRRVHFELFEMV